MGPRKPCTIAQNFVCRFNSAPKAGQKAPKLYKFVTNVAIRALGIVQATVRATKRMLPMMRFVLRRALGIVKFLQRMSAGRVASWSLAPEKDLDLLVCATICAAEIVEYETKPYWVVLRDEIEWRAASIWPSKVCTHS